MLAIVRQNIAARTQGPPCNSSLVHLMHDGRSLLFGFRRHHPINRPAHTKTRQFGKPFTPFSPHAKPGSNLLKQLVSIDVCVVCCRHSSNLNSGGVRPLSQ
jgi:hypothetical protein